MEFGEHSDSPASGSKSRDNTVLVPLDWNHTFRSEELGANKSSIDPPHFFFGPSSGSLLEGRDPSDAALKHISQALMEEDMEDGNCMSQEFSVALQAAEKSFYDVLGETYPPPEIPSLFNQNFVSLNESFTKQYSTCSDIAPSWNYTFSAQTAPMNLHSSSQALNFSFAGSSVDGILSCSEHGFSLPCAVCENEWTLHPSERVEEATDCDIYASFISNEFLPRYEGENGAVENKWDDDRFSNISRVRKDPHFEDLNLDMEMNNKQSAVSTDSTTTLEMLDMILLSCGMEYESALRENFQRKLNVNVQKNDQSKGSVNGKMRRQKQKREGDLVDLGTLLTLCAESVASGNTKGAEQLLDQIKQHSSPTGDGMQRLARYVADGLEARLAGCGIRSYTALVARPIPISDALKAQHVFLAACPFLKLSHLLSNKTIMEVSEKATQVHIIDFGINYGFQWPAFIEQLSSRPGGPPKLRITGIDMPIPGPAADRRIEQTGSRLTEYAHRFKVPFEFNLVTQEWETIRIEDIHIEADEVLVVNSLFQFKCLFDESVMSESPRDTVLSLVRKMNPHVFILGVVNAAHNAPLFRTRFREAMFHYSSMFDILETTVPREIPERMLVEKDILGREIMNALACEGLERIERPETYKQWQVRALRAGLKQLPLEKNILKTAKVWVSTIFHKDFVVDTDGRWLLQGWKGRILNAISTWKPRN